MIGSAVAWRKWLKLWLPGMILLVLNLAVLSTYRFLLAGQSQIRSARVGRLTDELEWLQERHLALAEVIERAEANRSKLRTFHQDWLASEAERLTRVIAEVKSMALGAGVETSRYRYPEERIEEFGLVRRSLVFSAEGGYDSMRRFIHALERSEQFLILDEISVSELANESGRVRVNFTISTLFLGEAEDPRART